MASNNHVRRRLEKNAHIFTASFVSARYPPYPGLSKSGRVGWGDAEAVD
jgi:hypothetical protein